MIEVRAKRTCTLSFDGDCWGGLSEITIKCYETDSFTSGKISEEEPEEDISGRVTLYIEGEVGEDGKPIAYGPCVTIEKWKLEKSVGVYKKIFVKAIEPSGTWDDIKIVACGTPNTQGSISEGSNGSTFHHTHIPCKSEPIFLTAYRIRIECVEKPGACLDSCSFSSSYGSTSNNDCECICEGEWREPEEQGERFINVDEDGENVYRPWYRIQKVNDNAIRAVVEPECLANMVEETSFSHYLAADFEPPCVPPLDTFPSAFTGVPMPWQKITGQSDAYFGITATIKVLSAAGFVVLTGIHGQADAVRFWINIAIDACNKNGDFGGPDNSEWEHLMQNHKYGLGKVIVPNHRFTGYNSQIRDCWDGFKIGNHMRISANASAPFVPITISLPTGIDVSNLRVGIRYPGPNTIVVPSDLKNYPTDPPGSIRIWTKNGNEPRYGSAVSVNGNGDFIPHDISLSYKAATLGFSNANHTITLYVEGLTEHADVKYYNNVKAGVQNTKIEAHLYDDSDNHIKELGTDKARYVVAERDTFYYQMVRKQDLRAAAASDGIYERADLPQFGLQLSYDPLTKQDPMLFAYVISKVDFEKQETLSWSEWIMEFNDGFNAGVYYDYCSRKSLITFQGTDTNPLKDWGHDWLANVRQNTAGMSAQYDKAMDIGFWIHGREGLINRVIFTGHSLGGGLASAATICAVPDGYVGPAKAITFNAAGLNKATPKNYITKKGIDDGGRVKRNYAKEIDISLAYYVHGEILDHLQSTVVPPRAFGGKQELEHQLPGGELAEHLGHRVLLHFMDKVCEGLELYYGIRES